MNLKSGLREPAAAGSAKPLLGTKSGPYMGGRRTSRGGLFRFVFGSRCGLRCCRVAVDCQAHSERACRAERQPFRARRQRRQARHATAKLSACANCTLRRARTQSSVNVPLLALTEQCARAAAYASLHAYDKLLLVKSEGIQLCGTVGDGSSLKRGTTLQLQNWTSKLKRGNQQLATNLSAPAG